MARQRKKTLLDDLIAAPWWVTFIMGIGFSILFLTTPNGTTKEWQTYVGRQVWQWTSLLLFFCSFISFISSRVRRGKFNAAKSIEDIRNMSWREFEMFVGEVFRRQGYSVEETGGGGADGGIDLILRNSREKVFVQCKQWRTYQVGVKIVREMYGLMVAEQADRVIIVSVGAYTQDAANFAKGKPIELIDGEKLVQLRRTLDQQNNIQDVADTHENTTGAPCIDPSASPICPRCSSAVILRTARKGAHAGGQFWGCARYPLCKGVVQL